MNASPPAVRIGVLAPLSRPGWTEAGRQLLAGLELAVGDVGDGGGAGGRPLALVVRDTAADPLKATAAVEELAELGVTALAGEYHSVVARAAAARAEALGLPFLCSSAVLDALADGPADRVARLAPPQSRGWRLYADFLLRAGHARIAVAAQPGVYWESGARILRDRLTADGGAVRALDMAALTHEEICDRVAEDGASALLVLAGTPDPAVPLVRAVRRDARLSGVQLGAPAGQPEFAEWERLLGDEGTAVPFLSYLPGRLTPLGDRVAASLRERLGAEPSFVAFEGYDTGLVLAEALRSQDGTPDRERTAEAWPRVAVDGTRGPVRFSRTPGTGVWQWTGAPVRVADRDPAAPGRFRVLYEDR